MTGRSQPSHAQLRSNLERRLESVETSHLTKRFNRQGTVQNIGQALDATGSDSNSAGFSPIDLAALNNPGQVTDANTPTDTNSLGLDIESALPSHPP
jgi:hypothetical protein